MRVHNPSHSINCCRLYCFTSSRLLTEFLDSLGKAREISRILLHISHAGSLWLLMLCLIESLNSQTGEIVYDMYDWSTTSRKNEVRNSKKTNYCGWPKRYIRG